MKKFQPRLFVCVIALVLLVFVMLQYFDHTCGKEDVVYFTEPIQCVEKIFHGRKKSNFQGYEITFENGDQYQYIYNFSDEHKALLYGAAQERDLVYIGVANGKIYHLEIDGTTLVTWEKFTQDEKLSAVLYSACIIFGAGAIIIATHYKNYRNKQKI